jgi:hypothetical protein
MPTAPELTRNPGDPITAADWRTLCAYITRTTPVAGANTRIDDTPRGQIIHASAPAKTSTPGTSRTTTTEYLSPYLITVGDTLCWTVTPGHVNGELPQTTTGIVGATKRPTDWAVPITEPGGIYIQVTGGADGTDFEAPYQIIFSATTLPMTADYTANIGNLRIGTIVLTPATNTTPATYSVTSLNRANVSCANAGGAFYWHTFLN